ncbi:ricin B-like lectin R40G3 [Olea europaea subsp. europaea]|uniref:Ricin B-like lectin R40G3 n=1 Tax=Olea europaea subsp. europaea TaxID=158383 RepID=A0A8S0S0K7_OLEEU|nr:ricin B-like lectin R40G3 [Olea europaea subsp. europaea]
MATPTHTMVETREKKSIRHQYNHTRLPFTVKVRHRMAIPLKVRHFPFLRGMFLRLPITMKIRHRLPCMAEMLHRLPITGKMRHLLLDYCKVYSNLTIRDGKVILALSNPSNPFQWVKDEKYSTRVEDEEGFPSFALINKATGQAMKHSIGATHPVCSHFSLWMR